MTQGRKLGHSAGRMLRIGYDVDGWATFAQQSFARPGAESPRTLTPWRKAAAMRVPSQGRPRLSRQTHYQDSYPVSDARLQGAYGLGQEPPARDLPQLVVLGRIGVQEVPRTLDLLRLVQIVTLCAREGLPVPAADTLPCSGRSSPPSCAALSPGSAFPGRWWCGCAGGEVLTHRLTDQP